MASRGAVFDNVSTTSNVTCEVPDLTGSIRKLQRKPIFNGTYSTVYEGELDGKKAGYNTTRFVTTHTECPPGGDQSPSSCKLTPCYEACKLRQSMWRIAQHSIEIS
jgi:hypothetical protein